MADFKSILVVVFVLFVDTISVNGWCSEQSFCHFYQWYCGWETVRRYCPRTCRTCLPPISSSFSPRGACLSIHNAKRALHWNTAPMVYDTTIEQSAQAHAEYLAANNLFRHGNSRYGENLYYYYGPRRSNDAECEAATSAWYDEIMYYNYYNPTFSSVTGHFTQVVWRGSRRLGVGIARNRNKVYVVARYYPQGNVLGQFHQNVAPLK